MFLLRRLVPLTTLLLTLASGCGEVFDNTEPVPDDLASMPGFQTRQFALEAPCMVNVEGFGMVDMENDYLPNVIACENGNAPMEALRAQAVQARGFVYYKLFVAGQTTLKNSQGDQVYKCNHRPTGAGPEHYQAVADTKGQYLTFNGSIIAPFYVAGHRPPNPDIADPITSCRGDGGSGDLGTEDLVTYNWGLSACNIDMSPIGWRPPDDCMRNPHNRGCASQNGETCLDGLGWKYQDMFPYYYGQDIQLVSADGQCGGPAPYVLTEADRFCGAKTDGAYCLNATTRVTCTDEYGAGSEVCAGGCAEGVCMSGNEPMPDSCEGFADGWYCLDNVNRVQCSGGMVASTETCTAGCEGDACLSVSANNVNPNNSNSSNNSNSTNNVNPTNNVNNGDGLPGSRTPSNGFPALVSRSPGTSGGCASAGSTPVSGLGLLVLGLAGLVRRRFS